MRANFFNARVLTHYCVNLTALFFYLLNEKLAHWLAQPCETSTQII